MRQKVTIIIGFLNTLKIATGQDVLANPSQFLDWLQRMSFQSDQNPSIQDVAWAMEFRQALRRLVSGNSGGAPSAAASEVVDRTARMAAVSLRVHEGGSATLDAVGFGLEGAVTSVLLAVFAAMTDGTWSRIKTCRNPECQWAFYDTSRNRSGIWCEMAACGNRMKARRFRERRREESKDRQSPGAS